MSAQFHRSVSFGSWVRPGIFLVWALLVGLMAGGCQGLGSHKPVGSLYANLSNLTNTCAETFSGDRAEGWRETPASAWQTLAGRYRAETRDDQAAVSLYTQAVLTNVFYDADYIRNVATVGSGGLVVRASEDFQAWGSGSGYMFTLGSDGELWQFAVYRQEKGVAAFLKKWTPHSAIQRATNNLAVLARNELLQFYINGELAWEGYDKALASGYVGLFGSTVAGQEASHYFDDATIKLVSDPKSDASAKESEKGAGATSARLPGRVPQDQDKSPVLRPGFLIRVTVLVSGKREIDAEVVRVSDNSVLDLPLIGPVSAKNMTLRELNSTLQNRYQDYFIEPQVLAEFVVEDRPDAISPWGSVVVLGRVRTPGRVNIPPTQDLTVSGAIQQAGGLDTSARSSAIRLTRRKADGSNERINIDFSSVGRSGNVENDLILQPGDVIFVPESVF